MRNGTFVPIRWTKERAGMKGPLREPGWFLFVKGHGELLRHSRDGDRDGFRGALERFQVHGKFLGEVGRLPFRCEMAGGRGRGVDPEKGSQTAVRAPKQGAQP